MLYELTIFGTYYNQQWINRFNYLSTGIPAAVSGSFGLIDAFGAIESAGVYPADAPLQKIRALMTTDVQINSIVARAAALYSPLDFYERPFPTPLTGTTSGVGMSPTAAFGFRTNRVRLDIARGTKRFPGVSEAGVDAGGVLTAGAVTTATAVAAAMSATISYNDEGNVISYAPCVVSKLEYVTPSGKKAYKYYATLEEQLAHLATGVVWSPYTTVRTQTSRQYGRGA